MFSRRRLLQGIGAAAVTAPIRLGFAAVAMEQRLVVVILRGALDGLAAIVPYGDPDYRQARGSLALEPPGSGDGVLKLDGTFGLHPALQPLLAFYQRGEFLPVQAVATPYRDRSHFDGQDVLENGEPFVSSTATGWLNRVLAELPQDGGRRLGLAVGQNLPLMLRGPVETASWAPSRLPEAPPQFIEKVSLMWRQDPLLGPALLTGLKAQAFSDYVLASDRMQGRGNGYGPKAFAPLAQAAGNLLAAPDGPRIAVLEMGGWDTHAGQGKLAGRLAPNLAGLAEGLASLAAALGPAWRQTVVMAISEFGRTVAPNGTNGTDHGTAGCALVLGGAVQGGRVLSDWPGLAARALYQQRDLRPTLDARALFKGILSDHLRVADAALNQRIFPDSKAAPAVAGLLRA